MFCEVPPDQRQHDKQFELNAPCRVLTSGQRPAVPTASATDGHADADAGSVPFMLNSRVLYGSPRMVWELVPRALALVRRGSSGLPCMTMVTQRFRHAAPPAATDPTGLPEVAPNRLNVGLRLLQGRNQVWTSDMQICGTDEAGCGLAIVLDLFTGSRIGPPTISRPSKRNVTGPWHGSAPPRAAYCFIPIAAASASSASGKPAAYGMIPFNEPY